ncbi:MAG: hypothetical protein C4547_03745 [Phycisphaerales bacterium]|nr:MAG: hypothetical protein C4547_03745 [Phycisphaerales bacterium]
MVKGRPILDRTFDGWRTAATVPGSDGKTGLIDPSFRHCESVGETGRKMAAAVLTSDVPTPAEWFPLTSLRISLQTSRS